MVPRFNSKVHFFEKSLENHQKSCFFMKVMFFGKKKHPAGLHHTEDRIGDTPNPPFQSKPPISNQNPSEHQIIESKRSAAEAAAYKFVKSKPSSHRYTMLYVPFR